MNVEATLDAALPALIHSSGTAAHQRRVSTNAKSAQYRTQGTHQSVREQRQKPLRREKGGQR